MYYACKALMRADTVSKWAPVSFPWYQRSRTLLQNMATVTSPSLLQVGLQMGEVQLPFSRSVRKA
jgi:hypothetical protein